MNIFSNILGLIFAPLFIVLIHYFKFSLVVLAYLAISFIFFIYSFLKKKSYKDMILPSVYLIALCIAYYFSSLNTVKYIPVTLSTLFLFLFVDAHFNKRYMILGFTKKFYPKKLSEAEVEFVKKGDGYWVIVMLINTLIHLYVVNFCSNAIWAFYSSIGWYILFFAALFGQIIYGKVYGVKVHSR